MFIAFIQFLQTAAFCTGVWWPMWLCLHAAVLALMHTTGAPVPAGADAVVKVEDTEPAAPGEGGQRRVVIKKAVTSGKDIRQVGSDIQ